MKINASLLISTYNWPAALKLVLLSVKAQTVFPNEVLIADDGSGEETLLMINEFSKDFPVPLIHVWHEDKGFRLAEIRNKAIKKANSNYLIQIDGDTILHKNFVKDHIDSAQSNFFISGSRVLIDKKETLNAQKNLKISFHFFSKNIVNRLNLLRMPFFRKMMEKPLFDPIRGSSSVRGCNMSFWLSDLKKVNGYNEDMVGWGFEDWELSARLINNGLGKKRMKFGGIQYHQYHNIRLKSGDNINEYIYNRAIEEKLLICENGLLKKGI